VNNEATNTAPTDIVTQGHTLQELKGLDGLDEIATPEQPEQEGAERRKLLSAQADIIGWAGDASAFQRMMDGLKRDNHWSGPADSLKNLKHLRFLRSFLRFRTNKYSTKLTGPNLWIDISTTDFAWWLRHGPSLGRKVTSQERKKSEGNERAAFVKAQLEHFIDNVVEDRKSAASLKEYEDKAQSLGHTAWSGFLVEQIVQVAKHLQSSSSGEGTALEDPTLTREFIQQARSTVFSRTADTKHSQLEIHHDDGHHPSQQTGPADKPADERAPKGRDMLARNGKKREAQDDMYPASSSSHVKKKQKTLTPSEGKGCKSTKAGRKG